MITGPVKSQIAQIWNAIWSGGISNPLEVIEQIRKKPSHVDYDAKVLLQQPVIVEADYAGASTMKLKHQKLLV
jgi:hypothetical protein